GLWVDHRLRRAGCLWAETQLVSRLSAVYTALCLSAHCRGVRHCAGKHRDARWVGHAPAECLVVIAFDYSLLAAPGAVTVGHLERLLACGENSVRGAGGDAVPTGSLIEHGLAPAGTQ